MKTWKNPEHQIYLPHPTKHTSSCVGEAYFFDKYKFWKLFVIFGHDWGSLSINQAGFSFMNRGDVKERTKYITDFLDKLGLKYSTSVSGSLWSYYIKISSKKSNLEIIDKEYKKFYNKVKRERKGFYKYENYLVSEEWLNEWNSEEPHHKLELEKI